MRKSCWSLKLALVCSCVCAAGPFCAKSAAASSIQFDPERGCYEAPFSLALSCPTVGAVVRYTLDGTAPTPTSGILYDGPVSIDTTTCVRAAAFNSDGALCEVQTHTYIFLDQVVRQGSDPHGFPATWGSAKADYEMNPDVLDDPNVKVALAALPSLSLVMDVCDVFGTEGIYANWSADGADWERPASIELIYPDGNGGFQVNCGVRLHGNVGRIIPKKSFRLLFKSQYGPTKLTYPLFGGGATDRFDQLILRAGFNDSYAWGRDRAQYIRDEYLRSLQRAMGHPSAHGRFAHLYINGLYWGLYDLTERPDASFAAEYLGGDKDDWDVLGAGGPVGDSSATLWNEMLGLLRSGGVGDHVYQRLLGNDPNGSANHEYIPYLDIDNYIDYMILNLFVGNSDWPEDNWYAAMNRANPSGWAFFSWDGECTVGMNSAVTMDCTGVDTGVAEPYAWLRGSRQFRMRFADRVHRVFFNGGPLYADPTNPQWNATQPERNRPAALYAQLANTIEAAIPAESARWGDMVAASSCTVDQWRGQRDWVLETYMPQRASIVLSQLKKADLYPLVEAPTFTVDGAPRHGGDLRFDERLSMDAPQGTVYYTLNGNDPRIVDEARPAELAIRYGGPVTLAASAWVKAATLSAGMWSALNQAVFSVGPVAQNLRISELMYHPSDPNAEYIELTNVGEEAIDLNLVSFTDGIGFTFPRFNLAPEAYVLVVKDIAAFQAVYGMGLPITGSYSGSLSNSGERIKLEDAVGRTICDFEFSDDWYDITDGQGFSLTVAHPATMDPNALGDKDAWCPSFSVGGSPGSSDADLLSSGSWPAD
jgi:hypothetical protein